MAEVPRGKRAEKGKERKVTQQIVWGLSERAAAPINAGAPTGCGGVSGEDEKEGEGERTAKTADPLARIKMHRPRPPPPAHAHTAVSSAGSQIIEGREPIERAGLDARYRVVVEVPRPGEGRGRVQRGKNGM